MKILHVTESLRLVDGGVARALHDLIAVMDQRGHRSMILTHGTPDLPTGWGSDIADRVHPIDGFPIARKGPFVRDKARIAALLRRVDLVHIHQPWHPFLVQVAALCRKVGTPYCVSLHGCLDDWPMSQKGLKKRISLALVGRRMLENAAFVHCTAEEEVRQSIKWFPRGRTVVVPCTMNLGPYRQLPDAKLARESLGLERSGDMLLYISRIHPKKGLIHLVRAMPRILAERPAWLCVAGPREDREYAELVDREIERLGIGGSVRFVGNVGSVDLKASLYRAAAVSVLPTSQENFGFVLFESLACATPLVVTDLVDTWRELKEHGGALIASQDPASVAEQVLRALAMPAGEREALGARARDWVLRYLDEGEIGAKMERAYDSATSGARARGGR